MKLWVAILGILMCAGNALGSKAFSFTDHAWLGQLLNRPSSVVVSNTLLDGLVAYWAMEEATGADRLSSTNSHTLVQFGTVVQENAHKGGSFSAECTGGKFMTNYDTAFRTTGSWSVSGWAYFLDVPANGDTLLGRWGPSDTAWWGHVTPTNTFELEVSDSGGVPTFTADSPISLTASNWFHFAYGVDTTNNIAWIQVNDESRKTGTCTSQNTTTDPLGVGWNGIVPTGNGVGMFIDEVAYWNRSIATNDVANLYNSGNGLFFGSFMASSSGGSTNNDTELITFTPQGSPINNAFGGSSSGRLGERIVMGNANFVFTAIGVYVVPGSTHTHTLTMKPGGDCSVDITNVTLNFNGLSGNQYVELTPPIVLSGNDSFFGFCTAVDGEDSFYVSQIVTNTVDAGVHNAAFTTAGSPNSCSDTGSTNEAHVPVLFKYHLE